MSRGKDLAKITCVALVPSAEFRYASLRESWTWVGAFLFFFFFFFTLALDSSSRA